MKPIARRIWTEPAACIGLLTTLALLAWNLLGDQQWDAQTITAILAPLVSGLGIRHLVTPTASETPGK